MSGVLQVFPSLGRDQVEQLRRTFAGMSAYEMEIRNARRGRAGRQRRLVCHGRPTNGPARWDDQ